MLVGSSGEATPARPGVGLWDRRIAATAEQPRVRHALARLGKSLQWLNREHIKVCRVPAPTFQEAERAEYLRQRFVDLGHNARTDEAGNVVVPVVNGNRLPYIAVTAHMDTTLAPSRPEDISVDGNGRLHGPGVTDNGSGLTVLLALARILSHSLVERPVRNILLVANVGEEGEGDLQGIRYIAEHSSYSRRIDRYLVVDGASLGHITTAALGSRRFELLFEGPGGHSWNDFGRVHPIHALARAIALMTEAELPQRPRATLSAGVIQGGISVNALPTSARAKLDVRSADEEAIQATVKIIEESARVAMLVENRRSIDRLTGFQLREIGNRPAARELSWNPVADCFRAVDDHLRIPSTLDCASTDANIPLAAGVPTVAVGAGGRGGMAHAPGEWYDPHGRDLGLRRIVLGLACLQEMA